MENGVVKGCLTFTFCGKEHVRSLVIFTIETDAGFSNGIMFYLH